MNPGIKIVYRGFPFENMQELANELEVSRQAVRHALLNDQRLKGYKIKRSQSFKYKLLKDATQRN